MAAVPLFWQRMNARLTAYLWTYIGRKVNKPSTPQISVNLSNQVISTELTSGLSLPIDLFSTLQWIPRANSPIVEILKIIPRAESAEISRASRVPANTDTKEKGAKIVLSVLV